MKMLTVGKTCIFLFVLMLSILSMSSCFKSNDKKFVKEPQRLEHIDRKSVKVVHKAHLSNAWYTQKASNLEIEIDNLFAMAQNNFYAEVDANSVRVIIVPHASYHYSGLCSATVYQTLLTTKNLFSKDLKNKKINKVIIMSPSHTTSFEGIALPHYTHYETTLGVLEVDRDSIQQLAKNKLFKTLKKAHITEHAIEIQLPFLQKSIEKFKIVPIIVGHIKKNNDVKKMGKAIKEILDENTLVVISSDFIHHGSKFNYQPFNKNILNQVKFVDSLAVQAISAKSQSSFEKVLRETGATICGKNPIRVLLYMLEQEYVKDIESRFICYYTSSHLSRARIGLSLIDVSKLIGNVADKDSHDSVSYVGMVFTQQKLDLLKKENQLTGYEKQALLKLARETVENELKTKEDRVVDHLLWPIVSQGIKKQAGCFVTINSIEGKLRGCVGRIASLNPLYRIVMAMAKQAAFHDGRFKPVKEKELSDLVFDISILTPPEKVRSFHEIIIGTHGIILNKFEKDGKLQVSSVFLPQVPLNYGWDLRTTLEHLSIKAGIGRDGWLEGTEFQVFEGFEIKEKTANYLNR